MRTSGNVHLGSPLPLGKSPRGSGGQWEISPAGPRPPARDGAAASPRCLGQRARCWPGGAAGTARPSRADPTGLSGALRRGCPACPRPASVPRSRRQPWAGVDSGQPADIKL